MHGNSNIKRPSSKVIWTVYRQRALVCNVCSTCSFENKKQKLILFWKGVQSSDSLAEELKKKHQVFLFTGIWKGQVPHLGVPEITYVWGSMPTRPTSHFKSVLNQGISQFRHFSTQYTPVLLSAVFVWEWGTLRSSCLFWDRKSVV